MHALWLSKFVKIYWRYACLAQGEAEKGEAK